MKKVSQTGAKLQIQNNPPGAGDQAGECAGAGELPAGSRSCAGRAAAAALRRAQGTAHKEGKRIPIREST